MLPSRKVNLEKELKRMHQPAAGYEVKMSPKDPIVEQTDRYAKDKKLHPAQQTGYMPPAGKKLNVKAPWKK